MSRTAAGPGRRLAPVLALLLLALGSAVLVPAGGAGGTASAAVASDEGWTGTKDLVRRFTAADGTVEDAGDKYRMTVDVDHTKNLRGRERVHITWRGARPSAGRAGDPFGENGINQEYPVMVLQCRGTAATITPETCWTQSVYERGITNASRLDAGWVHDSDLADDARTNVYGVPEADKESCDGIATSAKFFSRVVPFKAANGKVYASCDVDHMAPEAAIGAAFPANDQAAFTAADGTGDIQFEVRSDTENESLGCNQRTACAIVVVPIVGLSCDNVMADPGGSVGTVEPAGLVACKKEGQFEPGSNNYEKLGIDQAVGPRLWWSPSVWKDRFVVPVTFGPPPDACDVLDNRAPTGFYGSELLSQAALQWSPAYCLDKSRFKFQLNKMPDQQGFNLMNGGVGAAAEVSSEYDSATPVGYAPTAITGFGIGYVVDKPKNGGEVTDLKLNARLLAKLLTESYTGSIMGAKHKDAAGRLDMAKNPRSLVGDPEFQELNPGLGTAEPESAAALISLANSSDIMRQLTTYIASDVDAMDFIAGTPDPWGMVVNSSYKGIALPVDEWPLQDSWVPSDADADTECRRANPQPYFQSVAAPVTTLDKIGTAVLDGWPNVQTICQTIPGNPVTYKLGRVDRQGVGFRFVLGLVSLGDAERYGLRVAALEGSQGRYVAPTQESLTAAVKLMEPGAADDPFTLDQAHVRASKDAYPGTMVVYTAAKLQGLDPEDARKVAQFIRVSTTEGQVPGSGNGQLPDGFLPLRKTGATAALYSSAQSVAAKIEAEAVVPPAPKPPPSTPTPTAAPTTTTAPPAVVAPPVSAPPAAPSAATPSAPPAVSPSTTTAAAVPTAAMTSSWGGSLLPALLGLGLLAVVVTIAGRVVSFLERR